MGKENEEEKGSSRKKCQVNLTGSSNSKIQSTRKGQSRCTALDAPGKYLSRYMQHLFLPRY